MQGLSNNNQTHYQPKISLYHPQYSEDFPYIIIDDNDYFKKFCDSIPHNILDRFIYSSVSSEAFFGRIIKTQKVTFKEQDIVKQSEAIYYLSSEYCTDFFSQIIKRIAKLQYKLRQLDHNIESKDTQLERKISKKAPKV